MYQVVINDKYYISDVDIGARCIDGSCLIFGFETTTDKYDAKFFEHKNTVENIAEQIGGKVIEYIEKKDIQIDINCNIDMNDIVSQLGAIKLK